ncbi:MAG: hypothetical protein WC974_09240 [Thermoplasmata archaeon]
MTAGSVAVGDLSKLMSKVSLPEDKDLQTSMVKLSAKFNISYGDVKKHVLSNIGEFFADPEVFKAKYVNESKPMQEMAKTVEKAHDAVIKEEVNKEAQAEIKQMTVSADPRSRLIVNKVVSIVEGAMSRGHEVDTKLITSKVDEVRDVVEKRRLENLYMKALEHNRQLKAPVEEIKPVEEVSAEPIPAEPETDLRLETKDGNIPVTPTEDGGMQIGDNVVLDKVQTDKLKEEGKVYSKTAKVNAEVTWEADGKQRKGVVLTVHREAGKVLGYVVKDNETGKNVGLGRTMITVTKKGVPNGQEQVDSGKSKDDVKGRKIAEGSVSNGGKDVVGDAKVANEEINRETQVKVTNEPQSIEKLTPEVPLKSTNVTEGEQSIGSTPEIKPNQTVDVSGEIPTSEAVITTSPKEVFDITNTTGQTRGKPEYKSAKDKFDAVAEELVGKIPDISEGKKRVFKNDIQQLLLNAAGVTDPDGIVTGAKAAGVLKRYDEVNKIAGNYNQKSVDALKSAGILDYIEKVRAEQGTAKVAEGAVQAEQIQAMGGERKFTTQLEEQGFHIENPAVEKGTTKSSPERTSLENRFTDAKLDITKPEDVDNAYKDKLINAREKNNLLNEIAGLKVGEKKIDVPIAVSNYIGKGFTREQAIDEAAKNGDITQKQADDYKSSMNPYELKQLYNTTNFADQPVDKAEFDAGVAKMLPGVKLKVIHDAVIDQTGVEPGKVRTGYTKILPDGTVEVGLATLTGKGAPLEETVHAGLLLASKGDGAAVDKFLAHLGSDGIRGSESWVNAHETLREQLVEFSKGYRPDEYGMLSKVKEVWEKLKNFFTGHGMYSSAEIYRKLLDGDMTFGEIARGMNNGEKVSLYNQATSAFGKMLDYFSRLPLKEYRTGLPERGETGARWWNNQLKDGIDNLFTSSMPEEFNTNKNNLVKLAEDLRGLYKNDVEVAKNNADMDIPSKNDYGETDFTTSYNRFEESKIRLQSAEDKLALINQFADSIKDVKFETNVSLFNTADIPPNATTSKLFNDTGAKNEYKEKLKGEASKEQWKSIRGEGIIPQKTIEENEAKLSTFAKTIDHYKSNARDFIRGMSQRLWVTMKIAAEKGGATADLINRINMSEQINNDRAAYVARTANDILDGTEKGFTVKATPEETKNIEDMLQYFNNHKLKVSEEKDLPEFIKNMKDLSEGGRGEYVHYNDDGVESKVTWEKVTPHVWETLRTLKENETNKRNIAEESKNELRHKNKYATVKEILQAPMSKMSVDKFVGKDAFDLMGVDKDLSEQLRGVAEAVFANPYVKASEVISDIPKMAEDYFNDNLTRLDDIKKSLNSADFKNKYTFKTINGKEFDKAKWKSDKDKMLSQIKDYQNKVKVVNDVDQLRLLIGRNAEANMAKVDENNPRNSLLTLEDLANRLVSRWDSNASMERDYSEPIKYLTKLEMDEHFSDSYISRTLPNEKFVSQLQINRPDETETIYRNHYSSIAEAQKSVQTKLANKAGFIKMLQSKGQITPVEAEELLKALDERSFKVYHIKDEKNYFDELGRKLGYFDLQRILNQIGASKDTKEIEQINNYLQNEMLNRRYEERKGIAGGSEKLHDVFQSLKDLNSELSRSNSSKYLQLEVSDLLDSYKDVVDRQDMHYIQSYAKEMLRTTKAENSIIAGARTIVYGTTLFRPSQWIINATGLASTGLPVLARYHHSRALPELLNSFQQGRRLLKAYKMEEAGKADLINLQGEDAVMYPIFRTFAKAGLINPVLTEEQMSGETNAQRGLYKTSQKVLGFGNMQVEQVNRATALIAGYKIGMMEAEKLVNEGKINESEAEQYAFTQANLINAQINVVPSVNTPVALQKSRGVLRTLLKNQYMLKSFTHNYMHMYSQALKYGVVEGFKGSEKFDKGQLWSFAFANLPMLMLAGVGGVPFSSDMQNIVRGLFKKDTDTEMRKFMATLPGVLGSPEFADLAMNGLPTALGIDISKRTGMGDVLAQTGLGEVADMITGLNSFKSQQSILGGLKAGVDIPASTASTLFRMMKGDWKAIVDTPPLQSISMIRDLTNAVKQSQLGVQTSRGETLVKPEDLSAYNIAMQGLGFNSVKATNAKEAKTAMDMISGDRTNAVSNFREQMQQALEDAYKGNSSSKTNIIKAIKEWNTDNAEYSKPIMVRQVILSAIGKIKKDKKALREKGGSKYLKYLFNLYNIPS